MVATADLWVYNAENFCVSFFNQVTSIFHLRGGKIKKKFFLGLPIGQLFLWIRHVTFYKRHNYIKLCQQTIFNSTHKVEKSERPKALFDRLPYLVFSNKDRELTFAFDFLSTWNVRRPLSWLFCKVFTRLFLTSIIIHHISVKNHPNVMILVFHLSGIVDNCVTKSLNRSQCRCLCLCLLVGHAISPRPSDQLSERSYAKIKNVTHSRNQSVTRSLSVLES